MFRLRQLIKSKGLELYFNQVAVFTHYPLRVRTGGTSMEEQ